MSNSNAKTNDQSWGLSILRIHLGIILLAHGWLKISVFTIAGTVGYFASLGLPSFFCLFSHIWRNHRWYNINFRNTNTSYSFVLFANLNWSNICSLK